MLTVSRLILKILPQVSDFSSNQAIFHHVSEKAYAPENNQQKSVLILVTFLFHQLIHAILLFRLLVWLGGTSTFFPTKIMKRIACLAGRRQWKHEDWLPTFPLPIFRQEKYDLPPDFNLSPQPHDRFKKHTHTHTDNPSEK